MAFLLLGLDLAAICSIFRTTNSAGLAGAKPTWMFTIPRSMSFCVVVSPVAAHEYALRDDAPGGARCGTDCA
jgi:hypothetical protein